jgi:hypothetical protein
LQRALARVAIDIDFADPDTRQHSPIGEVLQPRQRRLAHQIGTALRRASTCDLESGIGTQSIHVIAILVSGSDHEHSRQRHLGGAVLDARRVAPVTERTRDHLGKPKARRDLAQHDHAAIRRQAAGIECGCEWFALDG